MKKYFFFILFYALTSNVYAQKAYMHTIYVGNINGNISITLGLAHTLTDNKFYHYEGYLQYGNNPQLSISGKLRRKDNFIGLTERDSNGNVTGFFNGYLNGNVITGVWSNPKETRKYNFKVQTN